MKSTFKDTSITSTTIAPPNTRNASPPYLMFLGNRVIPQHKEFLEYHGYEYTEIPEREFSRRWLNAQT